MNSRLTVNSGKKLIGAITNAKLKAILAFTC